jgi:hypothetical protein
MKRRNPYARSLRGLKPRLTRNRTKYIRKRKHKGKRND